MIEQCHNSNELISWDEDSPLWIMKFKDKNQG